MALSQNFQTPNFEDVATPLTNALKGVQSSIIDREKREQDKVLADRATQMFNLQMDEANRIKAERESTQKYLDTVAKGPQIRSYWTENAINTPEWQKHLNDITLTGAETPEEKARKESEQTKVAEWVKSTQDSGKMNESLAETYARAMNTPGVKSTEKMLSDVMAVRAAETAANETKQKALETQITENKKHASEILMEAAKASDKNITDVNIANAKINANVNDDIYKADSKKGKTTLDTKNMDPWGDVESLYTHKVSPAGIGMDAGVVKDFLEIARNPNSGITPQQAANVLSRATTEGLLGNTVKNVETLKEYAAAEKANAATNKPGNTNIPISNIYTDAANKELVRLAQERDELTKKYNNASMTPEERVKATAKLLGEEYLKGLNSKTPESIQEPVKPAETTKQSVTNEDNTKPSNSTTSDLLNISSSVLKDAKEKNPEFFKKEYDNLNKEDKDKVDKILNSITKDSSSNSSNSLRDKQMQIINNKDLSQNEKNKLLINLAKSNRESYTSKKPFGLNNYDKVMEYLNSNGDTNTSIFQNPLNVWKNAWNTRHPAGLTQQEINKLFKDY